MLSSYVQEARDLASSIIATDRFSLLLTGFPFSVINESMNLLERPKFFSASLRNSSVQPMKYYIDVFSSYSVYHPMFKPIPQENTVIPS